MTGPVPSRAAPNPVADAFARIRGGAAPTADVWDRVDPAGAWRLAVTPPSGRVVRAAVTVYLPADASVAAVLDQIDLVSACGRAKLEAAARHAGLPDDAAAAFGEAARALGAQLADRRALAPADAAAPAAGRRSCWRM
jgi:hypothetical protein